MTSTQTEPGPRRLSQDEAEERALLRCTHVAGMDALARLRTGGLRPSASYLRAARGRSATGQGRLLEAFRP